MRHLLKPTYITGAILSLISSEYNLRYLIKTTCSNYYYGSGMRYERAGFIAGGLFYFVA